MESVKSYSVNAAVAVLKKDTRLIRAVVRSSPPVTDRTRDVRVLFHRGLAYGKEVAIGLDSQGRLVADTGEETVEIVKSRLTGRHKFVLGNLHEIELRQLMDAGLLRAAHERARRNCNLPELGS